MRRRRRQRREERKSRKKKTKKTNKNRGKNEEQEQEKDDDAFERAMMSSEYSRLQTIKRERARQRTLSECEKLDVIADALANIEREKKELANARRHLRDMNRAAKAAAQKVESDGLGGGTVGIVGSSASSRRGDEGGAGIAMSSGARKRRRRAKRRARSPKAKQPHPSSRMMYFLCTLQNIISVVCILSN